MKKIAYLLPFAFLLHNLEETLRMEEWAKSVSQLGSPNVTTKQFAVAAAIFTILGFAVIFARKFYKTERQFIYTLTGFAGMLLLNVFFPHLLATLIFGRYTPGVLTAVCINLPLTFYILQGVLHEGKISLTQLILTILTGGVIGLILIFPLLKIGEILTN